MQTSELPALPRLDGTKVLIVDDSADIRDSLAAFFQLLGAEVKKADSGEHGLREWLNWAPSVVLSDIGMPGLNGYDFMRALRAVERQLGSKHTPTVAVSAYSGDKDKAMAKQAGFDRHVDKPADPLMLAGIVTDLLAV